VYSPDYYALRTGADADGGPQVATFRRLTAAHHLARLETITARGALLDAGCGEGYFLEEARQRQWPRLVGLDVSAAAAKLTHRTLPALQGSLAAAPFRSATFDVLTMFDSIEHVMDPVADLTEAARILKPNGCIYIVTPDAGGLAARLMGARWFQLKPLEHFTLLSRRNLGDALARVGFTDIEMASARKLLTPSFVHVILSTTNPRLAGILRAALGATPLWDRIIPMMTGDLVAVARKARS
jgi:SAM-dependent methyltransferase